MTHQELDELFRANSERGEFSPEPGEWEEMTAMLDEDERKDRYARWVSIGWMSLFVLLIGAGGYGLWSLDTTDKKTTPKIIATLTTTPTDGASTRSTDNIGHGLVGGDYTQPYAPVYANGAFKGAEDANSSSQALNESSVTSTGEVLTAAAEVSPAKAAAQLEGANAAGQEPEPTSTVTIANLTSSSSINQKRQSAKALDVDQLVVQSSTKGSETNTPAGAENVEMPVVLNDLNLAQQSVVDASRLAQASDQESVVDEQVSANPKQQAINSSLSSLPFLTLSALDYSSGALVGKSINVASPVVLAKAQNWPLFGVGVFAAEEATSVAMSTYFRLGTRVGAQLHYKPFAQWSLDLGVSYAHKAFMAPKGEMENTLGLFIDDVLPSQTDGESDLLEVPLTISYLPQGHGNAGIFVSGGLLSYRIFREKMVFHYDEPTSQPSTASASDMGAIFGTAHFQVGYRFKPTKGPAWRVGPYIQVPLSMVGSGELPIYSGGLQVELELF